MHNFINIYLFGNNGKGKLKVQEFLDHVRWVPVPTAWRVLGLQMEEWPPDMEVSCEYIE
jgi:hypothetical protein